jgi:hypothetical protein
MTERVLRKLKVSKATIAKDKTVSSAFNDWTTKGGELHEAIQASEKASKTLKGALGPKLKGIHADTDWRVKKDGDGGLVVEIVEREQANRRSRIDTETVDF